MNSKDEMSPLDSWICIHPGEGIGLNKQTQEMWIKSARGFRQMRGDILAACFEIENVLDEIIGEVFFPGLSRAPEESAAMGDPVAHSSNAALKNAFTIILLRASRIHLVVRWVSSGTFRKKFVRSVICLRTSLMRVSIGS